MCVPCSGPAQCALLPALEVPPATCREDLPTLDASFRSSPMGSAALRRLEAPSTGPPATLSSTAILLSLFVAFAHAAPTADVSGKALPAKTAIIPSFCDYRGDCDFSTASKLCAAPAPPPSTSTTETPNDSGRLLQLTCRAMKDALPEDEAEAHCCKHSLQQDKNPSWVSIQRFPRSHVEAAFAFVKAKGQKTVDFTFSGGVSNDSGWSGARKWISKFAQKYFTPTSVFVDTSADVATVSALPIETRT